MSVNYLILGGARSGKSDRALKLAEKYGEKPIYIATAEALDREMADRIVRHKSERGLHWTTVESPLEVASLLKDIEQWGDVCVIDCLTLWLSNLMHYKRDVEQEISNLCKAISVNPTPLFLVSNEVGLGLVPDTSLGREFRDAQGRLNQSVASICDTVEFIAAGLPLTLKE